MQTSDSKKQYRRLGHKLKPVVTVSSNGLSPAVIAEIERALADHELIKVKIQSPDRDQKAEFINSICEQTKATLIQTIGNIALLLRKNDKPNKRLSNLPYT